MANSLMRSGGSQEPRPCMILEQIHSPHVAAEHVGSVNRPQRHPPARPVRRGCKGRPRAVGLPGPIGQHTQGTAPVGRTTAIAKRSAR
jgi:hypothetical protein